jgi:pimeloyl-ACP methyl ester carboxylesterase
MGSRPAVQYAKCDGLDIAYAVSGSGPPDIVLVPGFMSHLDHDWKRFGASYERVGSFARLIRFDKRGMGLSERSVPVGTLEARMDDVRAVMDAAGSSQATLIGISEGGAMSLLFAMAHPDRVRSLVLWGAFARRAWAPDFPSGPTEPQFLANRARMAAEWGRGYGAPGAPPAVVAATAEYERASVTPAGALRMTDMVRAIDVRDLCASVRVPTLVLHRTGDPVVPVDAGRDLARRVPGARFVELAGAFHLSSPDAGQSDDDALDLIEEFVTGAVAQREPGECSPQCSSPTSSTRPGLLRGWATGGGVPSSTSTTSWSPERSTTAGDGS